MSGSGATIDVWMDASLEALRDVMVQACGMDGLDVVASADQMPPDLAGAFIPLAGERDSAQVGLAGDLDARQRVCGALMQMSPEEAAELSTSDVVDAMGEIVNIAAGGIKSRLQPMLGALTMGLPLFINGRVEATERVETRVARVTTGGLELVVVVVRGREGR